MNNFICKHFLTKISAQNTWNACIPIRSGHHMRGKPPGVAKSLDQRLAEINYKDPEVHYQVDIGFPETKRNATFKNRLSVLKANHENKTLESLSRNRKLLIDLEETRNEWLNTQAPNHIKQVADHYSIYEHLFGDAYFFPRVPLNVLYTVEDNQMPVYYGNIIKPLQARNTPDVTFESDDESLWTLIFSNPDGNFTDQDAEYVHWFVGNIPGNDISKGETIFEYLQPFPPKGVGYQRCVFILYKQECKIDYSAIKKVGPCLTLADRTFRTLEFYRERQDSITPAGLAFYQCDWDKSLTDFFHKTLDMKEPIYEYDFPKPYVKPQIWFPKRKPFNIYMDKYRDQKQINKEFLVRKLKNVHPFKPTPPPLPHPNAVYFEGYVPSWLLLEKTKSRLKWGRINDIE